ncbi:MAG: HAD family hydrolase [Pseudoxanthomonas suwonensis]|nr:HAD family hydrolase [Pseudoxanthomonas suwonensis]
MHPGDDSPIGMVGFDADDTLWRSQDYFEDAQRRFEAILGQYIDVDGMAARLYAVEKHNIAFFGYGVKGMVLSMIEAAVELTDGRVSSRDLSRIVEMGKELLRHPVELLPGITEAVAAIAAELPLVLITKGDLFHQEAKVRDSGLARFFPRIEIVSEKDEATYARLFREFDIDPRRFVMIGNSLRSDIVPVLALGGWGVHMPYHLTWAHERDAAMGDDTRRFRSVDCPAQLVQAVADIRAGTLAG